jgi:hypothetical protein
MEAGASVLVRSQARALERGARGLSYRTKN